MSVNTQQLGTRTGTRTGIGLKSGIEHPYMNFFFLRQTNAVAYPRFYVPPPPSAIY